MSILTKKDLHTPFNTATILKLLGVLQVAKSEQSVAASGAGAALSGGTPALHAGNIHSLFMMSASDAAAGESMSIDVLVNGASILTAPYVFDATKSSKVQNDLPLDPTKKAIALGDKLTVTRVYVAGGGPTMTATSVACEWS